MTCTECASRSNRRETPEGLHWSHHVSVLAGISYRQLDSWVSRGRITPVALDGDGFYGDGLSGPGIHRLWTDDQAETLRRVGERIRWGMTVDAAFREVDPPLPEPPGRTR